MRFKTSVKSLIELVRAHTLDTIPRNKIPKKEGYQFFDLHVHLPLPKPEEVPYYLKVLTKQVDGTTLADYGRPQSGIEKYDTIIPFLKEYAPRNFSVIDKGLVTIIKNLDTEKESILFRSEEIDVTKQGLDIMVVGIKDWIPNPYLPLSDLNRYDAKEIADKGREQGAFTYLEHFCAKESKNSWGVSDYKDSKEREELFNVFDHVDAVETFNGHCTLWMSPQNVISGELFEEYKLLRKVNKPNLSGSDGHLGFRSIGTAGILIPKLDSNLDDREIITQLKDNIAKGPIEHKKHYNGIPSFVSQRLRLIRERKRLKKQ